MQFCAFNNRGYQFLWKLKVPFFRKNENLADILGRNFKLRTFTALSNYPHLLKKHTTIHEAESTILFCTV